MPSKVATEHKEFKNATPAWTRCRDCVSGSDAIKHRSVAYLPALGGQQSTMDGSYEAYKARAVFYPAAERTVDGLCGAVLRKEPQIDAPDALVKDRFPQLGPFRESFGQLAAAALTEVLTTGRAGLLVDAPSGSAASVNPEPYLTVLPAEAIVNWRSDVIDGEEQLVLVVIKEEHETVQADGFETKCEPQFRVLRLDLVAGATPKDLASWVYRVEIWRKNPAPSARDDDYVLAEEINPTVWGGKPLDRIPFAFIGPKGTGTSVRKSPILDLVDMNLGHYRNSADLEHGLHFTALPQPWLAGFKIEGAVTIGSGVAWVSQDPDASAGYLEFEGAGLKAIQSAMDDKKSMMAVLGGRLLEEPKKAAEAAETVKMRHAGERSVLANIAMSVSQGLSTALTVLARWRSAPDVTVTVALNTDYDTAVLDAPMLTALMGALQSGAMAWSTFFYNLRKGEMIADTRTEEEERAEIEAGAPNAPPRAQDQSPVPPGGKGPPKA